MIKNIIGLRPSLPPAILGGLGSLLARDGGIRRRRHGPNRGTGRAHEGVARRHDNWPLNVRVPTTITHGRNDDDDDEEEKDADGYTDVGADAPEASVFVRSIVTVVPPITLVRLPHALTVVAGELVASAASVYREAQAILSAIVSLENRLIFKLTFIIVYIYFIFSPVRLQCTQIFVA